MAERLTRLTCVECGREQTDDERGWRSRIFGAKGHAPPELAAERR